MQHVLIPATQYLGSCCDDRLEPQRNQSYAKDVRDCGQQDGHGRIALYANWQRSGERLMLRLWMRRLYFKMLADVSWGEDSAVVADLIAPFVYKCWQRRLGVVQAGLPPQGAVVSGSGAMT